MEDNKNMEELQSDFTQTSDTEPIANLVKSAEVSSSGNKATKGRGKKVRTFVFRVLSYVLTAILSAALTLYLIALDNNNPKKTYVRSLINTYYDGNVDREKMDEGEIAGMVAGLGDSHSFYIPKDYGLSAFEESVSGEYAGIGVSMLQQDEQAVVHQVFEGAPAHKAGIKVGDVFYKVGGKSAEGKDLNWISEQIRGEEGTSIDLEFKRGEEILRFTVTRAIVETPSVTSEIIEDKIGYVKITQFDADSDRELQNAMDKMGDTEGVIIDLRDNPGGLFDVCLKTVDFFLDERPIVIARYKDEEEISMADEEVQYEMPLVVLINENSASSSEIFAVCMKDHKRATIIGTKSYGKGSIQTSFPLPDNTGLNLTIGHFYSPNNNTIDKVGVTPHKIVEYDFPEGATYDTQLQAAVDTLKK